MKTEEALQLAKELIAGPRAKTYGDKIVNHANIGKLWSAYLDKEITAHGVKGGEQDNVVLLTDLSRNTQRNYEQNPDDENRLFYVGATRTKNHLHVIRPKDIYKGYKI